MIGNMETMEDLEDLARPDLQRVASERGIIPLGLQRAASERGIIHLGLLNQGMVIVVMVKLEHSGPTMVIMKTTGAIFRGLQGSVHRQGQMSLTEPMVVERTGGREQTNGPLPRTIILILGNYLTCSRIRIRLDVRKEELKGNMQALQCF